MAKALTDIRSLARVHTNTCLKVLAGIVGQKDAPPAARVAAAKELMDRGWGKAMQTVEVTRRVVELTDHEIAERLGQIGGIGAPADVAEAPIDPSQLN